MKNLIQYGTAVMTLSDLVDDFCLAQNNMRENTILAQYRHARWSWKDLFRTTLWSIRKSVLTVDCKDHTVRLPDDCDSDKVIALSVVDCYGKLHPLGFNSDWNTSRIKCSKIKCSCSKCGGNDTLCGAIDSISAVTETVTIQGSSYTKTIYTRYDGAGNIQTETISPTLDAASNTIVYVSSINTICNVEVNEHGCIKATQPNMTMLRDNCGCGNFIDNWSEWGYGWGNYSAYRQLIPTTYNYWGEWNYNAADPRIIHIFGTGRVVNHYGHNDDQEREFRGSIRQVILDYQTNGEAPNTEILVPEYAVEAVQIGMVYRQKYLNPKIGPNEKLAEQRLFTAAKVQVAKYLNPVHLENVAKLQTNPRRW